MPPRQIHTQTHPLYEKRLHIFINLPAHANLRSWRDLSATVKDAEMLYLTCTNYALTKATCLCPKLPLLSPVPPDVSSVDGPQGRPHRVTALPHANPPLPSAEATHAKMPLKGASREGTLITALLSRGAQTPYGAEGTDPQLKHERQTKHYILQGTTAAAGSVTFLTLFYFSTPFLTPLATPPPG